jgi:hypothetical protein
MPDQHDPQYDPSDRPKTFEELAPDPDKTQGPRGSRVMLLGGVFVAVLTLVISLFSLLFAPRLTDRTPTPRVTATDKVLSEYRTETPTPGAIIVTPTP